VQHKDKELIMARPGDRPESAGSTLNPENIMESDRQLGQGHGTDALGPSDLSDTGSDIHGAPGLSHQVYIEGLSTGTTSDPEDSTAGYTDGPDIGDANLDSDSDSSGTGEQQGISSHRTDGISVRIASTGSAALSIRRSTTMLHIRARSKTSLRRRRRGTS
jgi:hypothetical protein